MGCCLHTGKLCSLRPPIRAWDDWDRASACEGSAWQTDGPGVWGPCVSCGMPHWHVHAAPTGSGIGPPGCAVRMSASEAEEVGAVGHPKKNRTSKDKEDGGEGSSKGPEE